MLFGWLCALPVVLSALTDGDLKGPFAHDLHLSVYPGAGPKVMICCHGMGGDYTIAEVIREANPADTLISFNFPDHNCLDKEFDGAKTTFGTINELLPALYVFKKIMLDEGCQNVALYGFSAGGGAIINALAVLNGNSYEVELKEIGIQEAEKKKLLTAIQQGQILLDSPLKSIAEIVDFRGPDKDLEAIRTRYRANDMEPINSVNKLNGLNLNILVHFQRPDEILSNRDDGLFLGRLKMANAKGKVLINIADDGGHCTLHHSLWKIYRQE